VDSAAPSQFTVDDATKSLPSIVRVNIGLPAVTLPGVSDEMDGMGFGGGAVFEMSAAPPPQPQSRAAERTTNAQPKTNPSRMVDFFLGAFRRMAMRQYYGPLQRTYMTVWRNHPLVVKQKT
jgi:hypothetical protein